MHHEAGSLDFEIQQGLFSFVRFLSGCCFRRHVKKMKGPVHDGPFGEADLIMVISKRETPIDLEEGSPEYAIVHAILDTRERLQITQSELARRTGIDQGDISKLERGHRNPSLKLLKRLADGLGMELRISFIPIEDAALQNGEGPVLCLPEEPVEEMD